jgi:hypothetical protein
MFIYIEKRFSDYIGLDEKLFRREFASRYLKQNVLQLWDKCRLPVQLYIVQETTRGDTDNWHIYAVGKVYIVELWLP